MLSVCVSDAVIKEIKRIVTSSEIMKYTHPEQDDATMSNESQRRRHEMATEE
jgi:hypothetical protein